MNRYNFIVLQAEWPVLHDAASKVESLAYTDPRTACFYAQRVAAVEKLKTAERASLVELDALCASLQHRAFIGGLYLAV